MKSRVFSSKLWKSNISGGIWLPMFLGIGFFFALPVAALTMIGRWTQQGYLPEQIQKLCSILLCDGLVETGASVIVVAAFLNALIGYFYLYSREKVDFYHSLPVNRTHMFLQKLYMGLLYTIIPYITGVVLTLLLFVVRGYFEIGMLPASVKMLFWHFLTYLFLYFCFVLVFCMTGTILMGVLSIFGIFFYGVAMPLLLNAYQEVFINNYAGQGSEFLDLVQAFTPFTIIRNLCADSPVNATALLYSIFWTVFFGVCAYFAYLKRPSEATGSSMVYKWFGTVLKFAVTIPCGLMFGLILYTMQPEARTAWGILGLVVGTLLTKGLMEVLYSFDFRAFSRHKVQTLLSLAAVFAVALFFVFDPLDFAGYIPAYEKLAGINFISYDEYGSNAAITLNENGEAYISYGMDEDFMLTADGTQIGTKTYEVLKEIVAQSKQDNYSFDGHFRTITYRLKSGGYVNRHYFIQEDLYQKFFTTLYEETNLRARQLSTMELDAEKYLDQTTCVFFDGQEYTLFANEPAKRKELADALNADFLDASPEELTHQQAIAVLSFHYENVPLPFNTDYMIPGREDHTTSLFNRFYVYPTYKRTIALLRETGFPLCAEDLNPEDASISITLYQGEYNDDHISYENYGPFQITDQKELEEIYDSISPFRPEWTPSLDAVQVQLNISNQNSDETHVYSFAKENVPACVQKLLEKAQAGELEENVFE